MIIEIDIKKELDFEADYMGKCNCGCNKELYSGMTTFNFGINTVYSGCLESYLNKRKVVL